MKSKCIKIVKYPASDFCEIVKIRRPIIIKGTEQTLHDKHKEFLEYYEITQKDFSRYFISDTIDNYRNRLYKQDMSPEEYVKLLRERTLRRAIKESQHSVLSNKWDYWVTFTFSSDVVDRYDRDACVSLFASTVKKVNRKYKSDVKYIVFPEKHEDGAYHLHGFIKNVPDCLIFRNEYGYRDLKVFNDMGHVNIKNIRSASTDTVRKKKFYCTKYCIKSLGSEGIYSHLYFKSNDLEEAEVSVYFKELERDLYAFLVLENAMKHSKNWCNDFVVISNLKLSVFDILEEYYQSEICQKYLSLESEIALW